MFAVEKSGVGFPGLGSTHDRWPQSGRGPPECRSCFPFPHQDPGFVWGVDATKQRAPCALFRGGELPCEFATTDVTSDDTSQPQMTLPMIMQIVGSHEFDSKQVQGASLIRCLSCTLKMP